MIPVAGRGHIAIAAGYSITTLVWVTLLRFARLRKALPVGGALIVAALLLRLPFLFADPLLSGDLYRYRWDGRVAASGTNPYAFAPDASEIAGLRDDLHASINHQEIPTIYPPLAQALFWLWGVTDAGLWLWRLLIIAIDLAIIRLSGPRLGLFWATCPFVILEGTWSGHLEIVVAAGLLLAWRLVSDKRDVAGGIMAGLAAGLKITPLAAIPALIGGSSRRGRFVSALAAALFVPVLPFIGGVPMMRGLGEYAARWEFNGVFYEQIRWLVEVTALDTRLKDLFTAIKDPLGLESIAPFVYSHLYAAWVARTLCLVPLAIMFVLAMRRPTLEGRVAWSVAALLLASPTVHPWYWLAVLPLAVIAFEKLLVAIALASPLSYVWYADAAAGEAASLLICYAAPTLIWFFLERRANANLPKTRTSK